MTALLALISCLLVVQSTFGFAVNGPSSANSLKKIQSSTSTTKLCMSKYKNVFVAGGTKGVGRHIIDKLVESGSNVVALARSDEAVEELSDIEGVTSIKGDAFDRKAVENAMDGCDAVVTTLGGSTEDRRVDYEGNSNVIESAGILGITRIILVTSVGCGSSREAAPPSVFEALKEVLAAKEKAENLLIKYYTNSEWTIVRPGGLISEKMTGKAILTEDNTAIGSIHREDVAQLVVRCLSADASKKILTAIDPTLRSAVAGEEKSHAEFELN